MALIAGSIIGGYVATSLIFFKYPNLIHRRKKVKFVCQHISHRGGAGENLENTLTAYEHAIHQGTHMLEIDLQLTMDGEVVVSHDNNLSRAAGVNKWISELNYSELPLLKPSLPVDFACGCLCRGGDDRNIPRLRELFDRFPQIPINIDIKSNNDLLIKKVSELVKEYNREDITVWGNASNVITNKCYKENPSIHLLFSMRRVLLLILLAYTGVLPFFPLKESCLEIPLPSAIRRNPVFREVGKRHRSFLLWLFEKLLVRKSLIQHLKKRGIPTYVWVLNEEDDFRYAFEVGATGVMTDFPSKLREYLQKHPDAALHR